MSSTRNFKQTKTTAKAPRNHLSFSCIIDPKLKDYVY